jgi:hypothetical protein
MGSTATFHVRLAASTRLILAMFRLIASIEEGFGQAVLNILREQYPDQTIDEDPSRIGHKLMGIAMKQNQYRRDRAMDSIQELLAYLVGAGKATEKEIPVEVEDSRSPSGKRTEYKTQYERSKEWNFATQTAENWRDALEAIYANLRLRSMSRSMTEQKRRKKERTIDEAYGTRGEGGEAPSGGEARMPTSDETALGKALDDKTAVKSFIDFIDEKIPELRTSLSDDTRKLFDLIFFDEIGSFGSDIQENMGQATALKEKHPELFQKNEKRWSGYVGDLRRKLLEEIWNFVDEGLDPDERNILREEFFEGGSATAKEVREREKKKDQERQDYQQGIDERKVSKWKFQEEQGTLAPKDKTSFTNLKTKLEKQGVDVDSIPALEKPSDKNWELHMKARAASVSNLMKIAAKVAAHWS